MLVLFMNHLTKTRAYVRSRFGRPRPVVGRTSSGKTYDHGLYHPFVLPFTRDVFTKLLERCKLSTQILDLIEHRTRASHISEFVVQDESLEPSKVIYSQLVILFRSFLLDLHRLNDGITHVRFPRTYTTPEGNDHSVRLQCQY